MSNRSPPPISIAAAAETCIGPCGPFSSGRHILRSVPWLDSAPSTAKATRSRSLSLAGRNNSMPGSDCAIEPRSTVTGRSRRLTNVTNSVFVPLAVSGRPGVAAARSVSPRTTLTGLLFGSPNVTISADSAFSAGSTPVVWSFADVPPRMILTACHSVSRNETIWTLSGFFSVTCLPITVVARCLGFTEALAAYPCGCINSSTIIPPGMTLAQVPCCIDPPTDTTRSDYSLTPIDPNSEPCIRIGSSTSIGPDLMRGATWRKF